MLICFIRLLFIDLTINILKICLDKGVHFIILTYFDILKSLRYKDLKVFISLYNYEKTSVSTLSEVKKESLPVSNSEEALENHIIKKLKSYNLLTYQKLYGDFTTDEYKIGADRIKIGMLGRNFVEFIKSKG